MLFSRNFYLHFTSYRTNIFLLMEKTENKKSLFFIQCPYNVYSLLQRKYFLLQISIFQVSLSIQFSNVLLSLPKLVEIYISGDITKTLIRGFYTVGKITWFHQMTQIWQIWIFWTKQDIFDNRTVQTSELIRNSSGIKPTTCLKRLINNEGKMGSTAGRLTTYLGLQLVATNNASSIHYFVFI